MGRFARLWATKVGLGVFTGLLALSIFMVSPLANLGVLGFVDDRLDRSCLEVLAGKFIPESQTSFRKR